MPYYSNGDGKCDLVITQNIPTPYRISFFDALQKECSDRKITLKVLYCGDTEWNRHWVIDPTQFEHSFAFLPGLHPRLRGATLHFNPTIIRSVRLLSPRFVIFGGSWNLPSNLITLPFVRKNTKRILWSEGHADAVLNPRGPISWLRKLILRQFDIFAVPNKRSQEWIEQQTRRPSNCVFLPNTVCEEFYRSQSNDDRPIARAALGISNDSRVLVQVSQLEPRKGVIELVRNYISLDASLRTNSMLVILGEGRLRSDLEALVGNFSGPGRILLPGHQSSEGVRSWLHAADWFVLNTHIDPNPLTPIEASFASLPLLLSKKAGNSDELLCNGEAGLRIHDASNPRCELETAMSLPKSRLVEMGVCARLNAERRFQRRAAANALLTQLGI